MYDTSIPEFTFLSPKPRKAHPNQGFSKGNHYGGISSKNYFLSGIGTNSNKGYPSISPRGQKQQNGFFENPQSNKGYARAANKYASPPHSKNSLSNSTSDSDSSARSDLSGFKIVYNGSIIHDESEDDYQNFDSSQEDTKYASSELTVGPNHKNISLPSFLEC